MGMNKTAKRFELMMVTTKSVKQPKKGFEYKKKSEMWDQ